MNTPTTMKEFAALENSALQRLRFPIIRVTPKEASLAVPKYKHIGTSVLVDVAETTGISPDAIKGRSHHPDVVLARFCAMAKMSENGMSNVQIGAALGRHYSTVAYGRAKWDELLRADE